MVDLNWHSHASSTLEVLWTAHSLMGRESWPTLPNHHGGHDRVSERADIQQSFVAMFMDDAEKKQTMAASSSGGRGPLVVLDGRTKQLETLVKRKIRAASYVNGGQDWSVLFRHQDSDKSGDLGRKEFFKAVRRGAGVKSDVVADKDLDLIYSRIDSDADGGLTIEEFIDWVKYSPQERLEQHAGQGLSLSEKMELRNSGVGSVREFVVLRRCVLRSGEAMDSKPLGFLAKGEVVAVSRASANRLKVIRLRVAQPGEDQLQNGWVSEKLDGGRGEPLLELLPRDEWSSRYFNEGAVAGRVALLCHSAAMAQKTKTREENRSLRRRSSAHSASARAGSKRRRHRRSGATGRRLGSKSLGEMSEFSGSGSFQRVSLAELSLSSRGSNMSSSDPLSTFADIRCGRSALRLVFFSHPRLESCALITCHCACCCYL